MSTATKLPSAAGSTECGSWRCSGRPPATPSIPSAVTSTLWLSWKETRISFGSALRADFDPAASDLDFLVEFDDLPPAKYAGAYFALKDSLEALFGRPVDLITEASLENPYFRDRVQAERQPVYAR